MKALITVLLAMAMTFACAVPAIASQPSNDYYAKLAYECVRLIQPSMDRAGFVVRDIIKTGKFNIIALEIGYEVTDMNSVIRYCGVSYDENGQPVSVHVDKSFREVEALTRTPYKW